MLGIVQRVIDKELQLGYDAQLVAHARSQFVAHLLLVGRDVIHNLRSPLAGKYTQIDTADAHVRTDATLTHTHNNAMHATRLCHKYLAEFLLYKASNLILSCTIHL